MLEAAGGGDAVAALGLERADDHAAAEGVGRAFERRLVARGRRRRRRGRRPQHLLGQELDAELCPLREHDEALDQILKLADVARPVVLQQRVGERRVERGQRAVVLLGGLGGEVRGEQRDVLAPLARARAGGAARR